MHLSYYEMSTNGFNKASCSTKHACQHDALLEAVCTRMLPYNDGIGEDKMGTPLPREAIILHTAYQTRPQEVAE